MLRAKNGLLLRRQPLGQLAAAVERIVHHGAVERVRLDHFTGARVTLLAGRPQINHSLLAENAELLAPLGAQPHEEGGHAVVVVLAPFLERMMMALGTLHAYAQEDLRRVLGPVGGIVGGAVEVGRAFGVGASLGGDDVADKLIDRLVVAQGGADPVVEAPHALFVELIAVDAQQVAPFEGPEIDELRPLEHLVDRLGRACPALVSARNALIFAGAGSVPMASR